MRQEQTTLRAQVTQLEAELRKTGGRQALVLLEQLVAVAHVLEDTPLEFNTLIRMVDQYRYLRMDLQALECLQQARTLAHAKKLRTEEGETLLIQADIFITQGKRSEAEILFQEAVRLARTSSNQLGIALFLMTAALTGSNLGKGLQCLKYLDEAEMIYRKYGKLRWVSDVLNRKSTIYLNENQINKALDVILENINLCKEIKNYESLASEYGSFSGVYIGMREFDKALDCLMEGIQELKKAGVSPFASQFISIQSILSNRGKYEEALLYTQKALEANERSGDLGQRAGIFSGRANILKELGRLEEALEAMNQSLALVRSLGNKRLERSHLLYIASLYKLRGDADHERTYQEQALAIPQVAESLSEQVHALRNRGVTSQNSDTARKYYQQALELSRSIGDWMGEILALNRLAQLERGVGKIAASESAYRQAILLSERVRARVGEGISGRGAFFEGLQDSYVGYLSLLLEQKRTADAFALAQKLKARDLLDLMASGRIDLSRQLSASERTEERQRRARCEVLSAAMVREAALNEPGSKKRFEEAKQELAKAERELALFQDRLYAKYRGLQQRRVTTIPTLAQVGPKLPQDAALLEFAPLENRQVALFVVTRDREGEVQVTATPLSVSKLTPRISALRAACTDPRAPWQGEATLLYQALLAPVEAQLRGKTQLILCPDRVLWDVPFAVLPDSQGTPLLSRFALSYASSATTWHAALTLPRKTKPSSRLLVLANPQFDAERRFESGKPLPGQRPITVPDRPITVPDRPITVPDRPITVPDRELFVPRGTRLVDLPGTQREADALAKKFPKTAVYTRSQAQESVVKREVGKYQRLHIATHAFVNDAAPLLSSVVLANPTPGSGEDGFLTAREIFDLDLSGVELVVLSACNTARGKTEGGEGVVGLTWALFAAGCPSQVLSQWSVDDASTASLMSHFYAGLGAGHGKARALRSAALTLRRDPKYAHPYYWAPFVLVGDPR